MGRGGRFSDAFCRFVQAWLPTFEDAELLVELYRNPDVALPQGGGSQATIAVMCAMSSGFTR